MKLVQVELLEPAITGTRNVIRACEKGKVKKLVVVSSAGAVYGNPNWPKHVAKDEDCWSDPEFCRLNQVFGPLPNDHGHFSHPAQGPIIK